MRDYKTELNKRIEFIREILSGSRAQSIVFGNSGGKDSALVGIICKMACDNTLGVMMPCGSKVNYGRDITDAELLAKRFNIKNITVDLAAVREALITSIDIGYGAAGDGKNKNPRLSIINYQSSVNNIAPRLRMTALYAIGQAEGGIVAGTGNRSERYMGYFTKWGDGAYDFNPIADLTATEVLEFLRFLQAPESITEKAPSAGLFEGQTDEAEMGVTYAAIDKYLSTGEINGRDKGIIDKFHSGTHHKRKMPRMYGDD